MPGGLEPPSDDDEFRPPLPPQDRVWRHPSELASGGQAGASTTAPTTNTHVRSVLTVTATAVLVAVAVVLVGGALELSNDESATPAQIVRLTSSSVHPTTARPATAGPTTTLVATRFGGSTTSPSKVRLGIAGIDTAFGVRLTECTMGGAAAAAGLQPGDVLVSVGDERVTRMVEVSAVVAEIQPGQHVSVTVMRDGQSVVLDLKFAASA